MIAIMFTRVVEYLLQIKTHVVIEAKKIRISDKWIKIRMPTFGSASKKNIMNERKLKGNLSWC